jgi:signal peptidase I
MVQNFDVFVVDKSKNRVKNKDGEGDYTLCSIPRYGDWVRIPQSKEPQVVTKVIYSNKSIEVHIM